MYDPIHRYAKGYCSAAMIDIMKYIEKRFFNGQPLPQTDITEIKNILDRYQCLVPFDAMPIEEGIAYAKFLASIVINHHRFTLGAPVVGGKIKTGLVTYKGEKFQFIDGANDYATQH